MRFLPGQSGNPAGRGRGAKGGRSRALMTLDKMLAKHANQIALSRALEVELRKEPVRFFRTIMPTSTNGLASGVLWNDAGTVKVMP